MQYKDYYQILGVNKNASDAAIKEAYRKLARKFHPDVNRDPRAQERFKEINEAYEVLKDPEKRKKYDLLGSEWGSSTGAPSHFSFDEILKNFGFTGSEGGERGQTRSYRTASGVGAPFSDFFQLFFSDLPTASSEPPSDITQPLPLTLEEAYRGGEKRVEVRRLLSCTHCHKRGIVERGLCRHCQGTGKFQQEEVLSVQVPAGIREGQKILLRGKGVGGGHLYLQVVLKPHPKYTLREEDLYGDLSIPLATALTGGEVEVTTLNGPVKLKIPTLINGGKVLKLRRLGFPKKGGGRGDLYVKIIPRFPEELRHADIQAMLQVLKKYAPEGGKE